MRTKLFRQNMLLVVITVLISSLLVCLVMYNRFFAQMKEQVKIEAGIISVGIRLDDIDYLNRAANASPLTRMTIIDKDGRVSYDSMTEHADMENHMDRPEVAQALVHGTGEAQRLSETLGQNTFYYAVRLKSGDILRIAETTESVYGALFSCLPWVGLGMLAVLILATIISKKQVSRIIAPINRINLEEPMAGNSYDELAPLLVRIEKQRVKINEQMENLTSKQAEFAQIADNMREGLVLLNMGGEVLTINKSAEQILGAARGQSANIITLCRSNEMQAAVDKALKGKASSEIIEREGRVYSILANPVVQNQKVVGAIMLLPDITETHNAEQMRREFSANVSHELKTPLTSISGYAEMIAKGMVRQEDVEGFAGRIYTEASRLIALVSDIIDLSQLDEQNVSMEKTSVDLAQLATAAVRNTAELAREKGVSLHVEGEAAVMQGVPQLLERMLNNLCENAVKYNNKGGFVKVTTGMLGDKCFVAVEDNGIGIPKAQQSRVFERFYRVDKSHSKETGGTGLGLSIVKHIVMYHSGELSLVSELDIGTEIKVTFM